MHGRLATVMFLLVAASGCGGSSGVVAGIPVNPWDKAIVPPELPKARADWAEGEIQDVSDDGRTVTVKITRGEVKQGETIAVFVKRKDDPGPHYLDSESREIRAAGGTVVGVRGEVFDATLADGTRRAPVEPGDRVVIRMP